MREFAVCRTMLYLPVVLLLIYRLRMQVSEFPDMECDPHPDAEVLGSALLAGDKGSAARNPPVLQAERYGDSHP